MSVYYPFQPWELRYLYSGLNLRLQIRKFDKYRKISSRRGISIGDIFTAPPLAIALQDMAKENILGLGLDLLNMYWSPSTKYKLLEVAFKATFCDRDIYSDRRGWR
jgi:hypothetical protein